MVKPLLCACFIGLLIAAPRAQDAAITANSDLHWDTGRIDSVIALDVNKKGIEIPSGSSAALQMIEMEAPSLLKDAYFSVLINSSEKLGNSVARGDVSLADLNLIIDQGKKTTPVFSSDLLGISLTHTVSLARIGSLFIKSAVPSLPEIPLDTTSSRKYTGILIDARGSMPVHGEFTREPLSPCLFPRIWSDDMDLLYEKSMVNPPIALQKSIVLYTSTLDESEYRDRIGTDPLRIIAREVFGTYRTDPVISTSDYLKIVSIPDNLSLLKNANVVIICNSDQLTESPLGPKKDKNYYFTYHEIDKALSAIPVSRIDFSNSWEGLKLTIYDIRFSADTANVLPQEKGRLDAIASALKLAGPSATFTVDGHTASVGKPAGELNLSIARARKIADELSARGIPANHIVSAGYGGTRPVATNETEEGRAKNRRVEITIHLD